jgi:hypothetical protein
MRFKDAFNYEIHELYSALYNKKLPARAAAKVFLIHMAIQQINRDFQNLSLLIFHQYCEVDSSGNPLLNDKDQPYMLPSKVNDYSHAIEDLKLSEKEYNTPSLTIEDLGDMQVTGNEIKLLVETGALEL